MKIRIHNNDGIGVNTKVDLIDGDNIISLLPCHIKKVSISEINASELIECSIVFRNTEIDIITEPDVYLKHKIISSKNRQAMEIAGITRIH